MPIRTSSLSVAALVLGLAALAVPACAPGGFDGGEGEGTDSQDEAVSGSIPVGSTLIATGNVNLRKGAGTSYGIVDVVQQGDSVTVLASDPKSGFYNVKYG